MPNNQPEPLCSVLTVFRGLLTHVPRFEVLSPDVVPYGLRPHTRSICWLAEQVATQNLRRHAGSLGIRDVEFPESDIAVWDVRFRVGQLEEAEQIHVNVKVGDATRPRRRNDIASVKKLLAFFQGQPNTTLLCVVLRFRFQNTLIWFEPEPNSVQLSLDG